MPDETNAAESSPQGAPGSGDEALVNATNQPVADTEPVAASEASPASQTTESAEPAATNWEQRAKDTQRALSERESRLQRAEVELEVYKRHLSGQPNTQDTRDARADLEKLQERLRNDPAEAVAYVEAKLAEQQTMFRDALTYQREQYEGRLADIDPASKSLKDSLKAIDDLPSVKFMSMGEKLELAKRMKATFGNSAQPQMRPPGGIGGQRISTPQKPPDSRARFAPYLQASGAVKPSGPKVSYSSSGKEGSNHATRKTTENTQDRAEHRRDRPFANGRAPGFD